MRAGPRPFQWAPRDAVSPGRDPLSGTAKRAPSPPWIAAALGARADGSLLGSLPEPGCSRPRLLGRLTGLTGHLVIALVILVVIGGATRVMQAGLACPDWPLCYGALLPGRQMNLQVFLEWFHRLDAFVVGMALLVLAAASLIGRRSLPLWLPWLACAALALVAGQGVLGALTVSRLLASGTVTAHLGAALTLLALVSGVHQALRLSPHSTGASIPGPAAPGEAAVHLPAWRQGWLALQAFALPAVIAQCLLGGWMASHWAPEQCLAAGLQCDLLALHRLGARAAGAVVLLPAVAAPFWPNLNGSSRRLAAGAGVLVFVQVGLGVATLGQGLAIPALTIAHQLTAALLVALVAGLLGQAIVLAGSPSRRPAAADLALSSSGAEPW